MKRRIHISALACLMLLITSQVLGQEEVVDRLVVPFSDPSKPGKIEAGLVNGGIHVIGYDGKEVIVEAKARLKKIGEEGEDEESVTIVRGRAYSGRTRLPAPPGVPRPDRSQKPEDEKKSEKLKGMIRIPVVNTGLTAEEDENHMEIGADSWKHTVDLTIRTPKNTSLDMHTINYGDIIVENVTGEIDVNNTNGKVSLSGISGAVVAHALNQDLTVTFNKVFPDKAMSFSTMNGDIDVTLPKDLKASLKMKSDNGEIYSDFDIEMTNDSRRVVEENTRDTDGKYRVEIDSAIYGKINGGGPEIQFTSFNGNIIIRKGE